MTVSTTESQVILNYTGPGDYDFGFPVFETSDIIVHYIYTDGQEVLLSSGVDYTVALNPDGTGTVSLTYDIMPYIGTIRIRRVLPVQQLTDWVNNSAFDMDILETDLDRIIMILQQLNTTLLEGLTPEESQNIFINSEQLRGRVTAGVGPVESLAVTNFPVLLPEGGGFVGFDASSKLGIFGADAYQAQVRDHPLQKFWGAGGFAEDDESGTELTATRQLHGVQIVFQFPTIATTEEYQCWVNGTNVLYVVNRKTKDYNFKLWLSVVAAGTVDTRVKFEATIYQFGENNDMLPALTPGLVGPVLTIDAASNDPSKRLEYTIPNILTQNPAADDIMLLAISFKRIAATPQFDQAVDVYAAALEEVVV